MAKTTKKSSEEVAIATSSSVADAKAPAKKKVVAPKVTLDTMVEVASCVYGGLIWKSKKTGYTIVWNEFGEKVPMTVSDLMDMRNGSRDFFEKNWITIEDPNALDVLKYLQVDKFYKDVNSINDVDVIFSYEPDEISGVISNMNSNLKEIVAFRAAEKIRCGELDSNAVINAISDATGFDIRS